MVDVAGAIGKFPVARQGQIMRSVSAILFAAFFAGLLPSSHAEAQAQSQNLAQPRVRVVMPGDDMAQLRRRPRVRIYRSDNDRGVSPRYFPGSNAVRDCTATYVQEFRPSGTVITPRMSCHWRQP